MRARLSRLITRQGLLDMVTEMMWLAQWGLIMSRLNLTSKQEMQIWIQGLKGWLSRTGGESRDGKGERKGAGT